MKTSYQATANIRALTSAHQIIAEGLEGEFNERQRKCYDALDRAFADAIRAEAERMIPARHDDTPSEEITNAFRDALRTSDDNSAK